MDADPQTSICRRYGLPAALSRKHEGLLSAHFREFKVAQVAVLARGLLLPVPWDKRRSIAHVGTIPGDICRNFSEFPGFLFLFFSILMLNVNSQTKIFLRDFYFECFTMSALHIFAMSSFSTLWQWIHSVKVVIHHKVREKTIKHFWNCRKIAKSNSPSRSLEISVNRGSDLIQIFQIHWVVIVFLKWSSWPHLIKIP